MICRYCRLIHSKDGSYPLREATRYLESDFPRCEWHWRYVCDICGTPRHFNGITWCEEAEKFICLRCGDGNKLVIGDFWAWETYYVIRCPSCNGVHPALDRLEFEGRHPWQLNPGMRRKKVGLSEETRAKRNVTLRFLSPDETIGDDLIMESWDMVADRWFERYTEYGDINRRYVIDPVIFKVDRRCRGEEGTRRRLRKRLPIEAVIQEGSRGCGDRYIEEGDRDGQGDGG